MKPGHKEALELAQRVDDLDTRPKDYSNLARCYLEVVEQVADLQAHTKRKPFYDVAGCRYLWGHLPPIPTSLPYRSWIAEVHDLTVGRSITIGSAPLEPKPAEEPAMPFCGVGGLLRRESPSSALGAFPPFDSVNSRELSLDVSTRRIGTLGTPTSDDMLNKMEDAIRLANRQRIIQRQHPLMIFDPQTGESRPYPSEAQQYRIRHGNTAWLFNPWSGNRRLAADVGSDPQGFLILPPGESLYA